MTSWLPVRRIYNLLIPLFTVIRSGTNLVVMDFRDFKVSLEISGKSDLQ